MGQREQSRFALGSDSQDADHVESEEPQDGEIFLSQGLVLYLRADQAKPSQRSWPCTMRGQCCRRGFSARANQNLLYSPTSVQDQSDGAADLVRELCEGFCGFKREDLVHGYTTAIQSLKHCELAGAETEDLSVNFWNGRRFLMVVGAIACTTDQASEAWASMSRGARRPARRACLPAAAIIAALSVQ